MELIRLNFVPEKLSVEKVLTVFILKVVANIALEAGFFGLIAERTFFNTASVV